MPIKLIILEGKKHTLQHLKLEKLKFGVRKIGCLNFDELNEI